MARRAATAGHESRSSFSKSSKTKKAESQSRQRWVEGLSFLLRHADQRFGDVAWATNAEGTEDVIWAHKALLYARSSAGVLHRYLQGYRSPVPPASSSNSSLVNLNSAWNEDRLTPSMRSVSPDPSFMSAATIRKPMQLEVTDRALLDPLLQYIYTGQGQIDAFAFLFEEAQLQQSLLQDPLLRLSQDLLFMWRSKLYADVLIQLVPANTAGPTDQTTEPDDTQGEVFASHRAILATVPYFESILLGSYGDSDHRILTLPTPPLTPASLHFVLGYLYCGTLDFSQRSFDLTTAFAIYNSAQYLGMDALRPEIECRIEDMCFGSRPDPLRCARLYQWSLLPDVNCPMLQQRSKGVVLDRFGEAWRIEVGSLAQEVQQLLVTEKCLSMTPETAVDALRGVMTIRSKLETITQSWAAHVLAMLEPVEARVAKLLVLDTTAVVTSPAFVDLIEGRTFSADLLEQALQVLARNLEERTAALAYQAVVGHVLLREQGIQVDARVLVEDCRQAILKYLKSRWVGAKAAAGFNDLDSWSLKEIADELDMKPQDLIAVDEPPPLPATKTGLRPVRKSATSNDSDPSLRTSLLNRNAASTMMKNQGRITPRAAPSRIAPATRARPLRPTNNLASSSPDLTSSSLRSRSTATSDASTRKPRTSQSTAASDTTAETSAEDLQASTSSSTSGLDRKDSQATAIPSGRRSAEPSSSNAARSTTAVRRPAQPASRIRTVSQDGASTRTSVRSTAASLARERATAAAREKATPCAPPIPTRPPRAPSSASVRSAASKPPSTRPAAISTRSTAASVRSATSARTARSERSAPNTPTPTTPTPKSPGSRPSSAASYAPTHRSISSRSLATSEKAASTKTATSVASKRTAASSVRDRKTSAKSASSSSNLSVQHGRVAKRPAFGTSLNVGIRCVVSFTNGQKSTGSVLYLGPVPEMSAGNWVGVEIDEPDEVTADDIEWNDGQLEGIRYFTQSRKRRNMQCGVFVRPAQVMYLF